MNIPGLSNLGSIGKLLDPGALVKDVVNGFLPKDMKVVGDVAGAVVDLKTGNFLGAAQLGMEAVKDLPQAAKGLQGDAAKGSSNPQGQLSNGAQSALEPPPLPASQRDKPLDMRGLSAAIEKLTKLLTDLLNKKGTGGSATSAKPDDTTKPDDKASAKGSTCATKSDGATDKQSAATSSISGRSHGEHVHVDVHTHAAGGWRDRPQAGSHAEARPSGWRGEPRTDAPSERTDAQRAGRGESRTHASASGTNGSSAAPATSTSSTATPATQTPSTDAASAANSAKGQTITSLEQIKGMSDSAIRDAVINGRISPEVAKDQTAMMVLQQRMQAITEMNNLMTGMLRALHDMQMAVIQNIRI